MAKSVGKLFFRFYIYIDWQKDVANRLKYYIYNVAKYIGKSLEIQTNNYKQLQTIIDNYRCKIE